MESTIRDIIDALGGNVSPDIIHDHIKHNPNHVNEEYSSKEIAEQVIKLSHKSSNPKMFIKRYEEMKTKNVDSLDFLISLFFAILCDKKAKNPKPKLSPKPVLVGNKSYISKDDLNEIKSKIGKAVDDSHKLQRKNNNDFLFGYLGEQSSLSFPPWLLERSDLSWDFKNESYSTFSIADIPKQSQELILIDDLLFCLEGIPGKYIIPLPLKDFDSPRSFSVSSEVDMALKQIIQQILPLASYYSVIQRFIESISFNSGRVLHALVNAMETLLKDYYVVVAQFETEHIAGTLNLQKLWYFVQPIMHIMEILANVSTSIKKNDARGGAVLSLLHEQTNALLGNTKAQDISLFLTQKASQPYMQMLQQWIYKGAIDDPFQEFLVEDNEVIKKEDSPLAYSADYWEKRYTIQRDCIPKYLDRFSDIILRTGKYLNVISQCGKNIVFSDAEEIKYTLREQEYLTSIQKAYSFASKSLLELLMKEYDLMGHLKSVKHYFLMDQGDFIVQFMDASEQELAKNIDDIIPTRLESLLGLCLRLSAANHDPYNENMKTELLPYDLKYQMFRILSVQTEDEKDYRQNKDKLSLTGWESFSFGIDVKWPVSLILNREAIACYQMIFRHLFYCKHVERMLCKVWLYNKVVKKFSEARQYGAAFALRQRMLTCLQNLLYYMCVEVMEPNWCNFIASLNKVTNVDEVLEKHSDFQKACMEDCMLTNLQLLNTVTNLCRICVQFCQFFQEMRKYFVDAEMTGMIGSAYEATESIESLSLMGGSTYNASAADKIVLPGNSFEESITRFDLSFTAALLSLLNMINDMAKDNNTKKLVDVMYRLNFNTFYSEQLDRLCMENSINQTNDRADHSD